MTTNTNPQSPPQPTPSPSTNFHPTTLPLLWLIQREDRERPEHLAAARLKFGAVKPVLAVSRILRALCDWSNVDREK